MNTKDDESKQGVKKNLTPVDKDDDKKKPDPLAESNKNCKTCGDKLFVDWNGKGDCITCARDKVLGTTSHKSVEVLKFRPRNIHKSFLQFYEFMEAVRAEKSVAYLTPHGEVSSPKRTEQLLTAQKNQTIDEVLELLVNEKLGAGEASIVTPRMADRNQLRAELRKTLTEMRGL